MDEPTNDLDVETLRALENAILEFPGCAMVISHDRWFLDRIATHILDNMRKGIIPNINELESIYTFVNLGVTGFLLASETSIGNYPVKSVEMLKMLINLYKK